MKFHRYSTIYIGINNWKQKWGYSKAQCFRLCCLNVYLEEEIMSKKKFESVQRPGYLLAFADDMLVITSSQHEIEIIISEFTNLNHD
jgi:hypothetical protein